MSKSNTQSTTEADIIKLHNEVKVIKENHLAHIHDCIHRVEEQVKEQRTYFTGRLDRLDNRIWWIMGIAVSTLLAIIVENML